jgi:hypothetical protein
MTREFLVTKFVCAACGDNLSLTYDMPTKSSRHSPGEPTGAAMVEQRIAVNPCRTCAAPLGEIRSALATLARHGDSIATKGGAA